MNSDRGRKYENGIEHHRRRRRLFGQRMGSAGNQCFAGKLYVWPKAMGGARRDRRDRGGGFVALGQSKKERRALTHAPFAGQTARSCPWNGSHKFLVS
jgi:hypothetical protein